MIDLTGNNEITAACDDWLEAMKQIQKWTAVKNENYIKIINTCNKNQISEFIAGNFEVSMSERKGSEGRVITLDDVGTITGQRKASQSIKINQIER